MARARERAVAVKHVGRFRESAHARRRMIRDRASVLWFSPATQIGGHNDMQVVIVVISVNAVGEWGGSWGAVAVLSCS